MEILVLGGTRYIGVHLVENLIKDGHDVTIGTRGTTLDKFGNSVNRIVLDRTNPQSLASSLQNKNFDVIYDSLAYCSNEVKYLLDVVNCKKYIQTSTLSTYIDYHLDMEESEFNPLEYKLKWCASEDYAYDEIKRQAECAIYQHYSHIPSISVRFPYVIGLDDYTKRLYFYVEHVAKSIPMFVDNLNERLGFINSTQAGEFLAWLVNNEFTGSVNASSYGTVTLSEVIKYVENKLNKTAVMSIDGEPAPYNGAPTFSLSVKKAEKIGYQFSDLNDWVYELLDSLITQTIS